MSDGPAAVLCADHWEVPGQALADAGMLSNGDHGASGVAGDSEISAVLARRRNRSALWALLGVWHPPGAPLFSRERLAKSG